MASDWFPRINAGLCVDDCFKCANFCPHKVFEKGEKKPVVARPDDCIEGCHACEELCPHGAISFQKEEALDVSGVDIGLVGLSQALKMPTLDEAFRFLKENNYIPDTAEDEYREALRKVFRAS